MSHTITRVKLPLGRTVATPGVLAAVAPDEMARALARHASGDWGDLGEEDWAMNDRAAVSGEDRILSSYMVDDTKFWIITEWDRSVTTVLLPEDY